MPFMYLSENITTTEPTSKEGVQSITSKRESPHKTYQVEGSTTSGTGSAVVVFEGSHTGRSYDEFARSTLTLGIAVTSDSFTSSDRYTKVRTRVISISGTGSSITTTVGV